jgi:hypothetical protein
MMIDARIYCSKCLEILKQYVSGAEKNTSMYDIGSMELREFMDPKKRLNASKTNQSEPEFVAPRHFHHAREVKVILDWWRVC